MAKPSTMAINGVHRAVLTPTTSHSLQLSQSLSLHHFRPATTRRSLTTHALYPHHSPKRSLRHRHASTTSTSTSSPSRRRAVTVLSDDGATPWTSLSRTEKLARTTQQTFNLGIVLVGAFMTCGIVYLLWTNVAAPSSKTALFNRCISELKSSARIREAIGPANKIRAFGQASTWNKWQRNAAIPATYTTDAAGKEHARLTFHVEGPHGKGIARAHLVRDRHGQGERFEFVGLNVEINGRDVIWVFGGPLEKDSKPKGFKFLGIGWGK